MTETALKELLSTLSLEEKIGELFQIPPYFFDGDNATGPALEMGLTDENIQLAGSCLSITGAKKLRDIQTRHMNTHPHNIPMLFMADIINGYRTVFPIPLAQGCTFDPGMVEKCASIAAAESAAAGLHVTFSPMADLCQDARWGRVMEGTGEDPYLNGLMAAASVKGYQGTGENELKQGKIAACLKHFAGYGAPLGGRDYNTVELSNRTLREDYLPAYQAAVEAGCKLVMTSFNTLDRIPSTANRWLMRSVLREEMGFDGVLISDWAAIVEMLPHGIARDEMEAAKLAMDAGVDIDMATPIYVKNLKTLIDAGAVSEEALDEAVLRVLTLKNELGLFENPNKDGSEEAEESVLLCSEHRQTARECAEKTFVLLKNQDSLLPLNPKTEKIAVIGPYADNKLLNGAWSFFGNDEDTVTIREGICRNYPEANVTFAQGCTMMDPGVEIVSFQKPVASEACDTEAALAEAVALAKAADKVVLALGEHRELTGEGASRAFLTLPACQLRLLQEVTAANPNTCVVLFSGRPLDIRAVNDQAKAILQAWMPGTEGGSAIARVLFGDTAPTGKLTMSFPYCVGQVPVFYNQMNTGRPFHGDFRKERFASKYVDIPNEPLFPFGHGLTYTSFSCSEVLLSAESFQPGQTVTASVTVTNTGSRIGTETVQLYIRDLCASVTRPVRLLKGFQKVTLAPGESREITFEITEPMLRFYDVEMNHVSEPGDFHVFVGFDSTTDNKAALTLL